MQKMPYTSSNALIADGESLSGPVQLVAELTSVIVPESWTAASITFQGSIDGVTFFDIYDYLGAEVTIQAGASRMIAIDDFKGASHMKLRSGTSASPVPQDGNITLTLVMCQKGIL